MRWRTSTPMRRCAEPSRWSSTWAGSFAGRRSPPSKSPGAGSSAFRFFSSAGCRRSKFSPRFRSESAGFDILDPQNPWVAAVQLDQRLGATISLMCWPCCAGCCRWPRWLGGCLRPGPQPGAQAHGAALRFRPVAMIVLQAAWLASCRSPSGAGSAPCNGSPPRTSPQPPSRTWSATPSGPSFSRWASSPHGRWSVGRSRSRRC